MVKSIEIIRKNEQHTSKWSGGTTTQLLIYPKDADYSARSFKWRISSAKVEMEESTFTSLPGISRILMILEGELFLNHEGHYNKTLKPFEQDSFIGDWITKSVGKVTDFNLMMAEGCTGRLEALSIKDKETAEIQLVSNEGVDRCITAFYTVSGEIEVICGNDIFELTEGDILSINLTDDDFKISLSNKERGEAKIIKAEVFY